MIYETIFGRIMLGFESTKQGLLSTENLYRTSWMLCEVQQATSMADQSGANKFTNKSGKIRCNGIHTVSEIFGELGTVCRDGDDLITKGVDVCNIGV